MNAKITVNTTAALQGWNKGMEPALAALDVTAEPPTVSAAPVLVSALTQAGEALARGFVDGSEYLAHLSLGFLQAMDNLESVEQHNSALAAGKSGR